MSVEHSADSTLDDVVRQVLGDYSSQFCSSAPKFLSSAGGFSGARLWQVQGETGLSALRAMPRDSVNLTRLRGLHRLLGHVRHRSLPGVGTTAPPFATRGGDTIVVRQDWVWQLEPWLPGVADFCSQPSPVRLKHALEALARWHGAAQSFIPTADVAGWFRSSPAERSPGLAERLQLMGRWDSVRIAEFRRSLQGNAWPEFSELGFEILDHFSQCAPAVMQQLRLGSAVAVPLQPCLRDIWHDHVLFSADDVSGLIDAHSCRRDCVATDLARLLGSLVGDDRRQWDAGLAAYSAIRPLSLPERGLVEIFDRSAVVLNGLTWLEWHCVERRPFRDPAVVVERLRRIVDRLAALQSRV